MITKIREAIKRKDNEKGFTLVELIVVMAILAVLAGLAVPQYTGVLSASKDKANQANLRMLENAGELWYANQDKKPSTDITFTTADSVEAGYDDFVPDYLKKWPDVPNDSNKSYEVKIASDGTVTADAK